MSHTTLPYDFGSATTADKLFFAQLQADLEEIETALNAASIASQIFSASGTYTPTTGMTYAIIEVWGGGGGGGGAANSGATSDFAGGGGGAGSYSRKLVTAATVGASQTVTIGAAGAGGANTGGAGGNGGDTSVGALVVGKGGIGGSGATTTVVISGGAGGMGGTGDVVGVGEDGTRGYGNPLTTAGFSFIAGGGCTIVGRSAPGSPLDFATAGPTAVGYGAGGGGALSHNAGGGQTGGAGVSGFVAVTEFIL